MKNWINNNKYRPAIELINKTIKKVANNTDYDNILSITNSSKLVRFLWRVREKLYVDGEKMRKQQKRETLLERYIQADSEGKPKILAQLYIVDEELKGEENNEI